MSLEPIGREARLDVNWLSHAARSLYYHCETGQELTDAEPDPGYFRVVEEMIAIDLASANEEFKMKVSDIAARLLTAWAKFHGLPPEPIIANFVQLKAWEAVARWLAYAVQCESETVAAEALALIYDRSRQEIENGCRTARPDDGPERQEEARSPAEKPAEPRKPRKQRSDAGKRKPRKVQETVGSERPRRWAPLPEDPEDEDGNG